MRALFLTLTLTGCNLIGGGISTYHCDFRGATEGGEQCQEYGVLGPDILPLSGTCAAVGGAWAKGECARDGILGGCENIEASNPWEVTTWYYEDVDGGIESAADVEADCDPDEEQFIAAP